MRRKADWSHAGGPLEIFKACQDITAGKGRPLFALECNYKNYRHLSFPLGVYYHFHICVNVDDVDYSFFFYFGS